MEWFHTYHWESKLKKIDEIVLVGKSELDSFKAITGKDNVVFIPHGIRTDFYCPDPEVKKERMLLTVGNWLRDYEFAKNVYQRLLSEDKNLKIVVVAMPKMVECLKGISGLRCQSGISDEELRDLYRCCSVLFLPLKRFTANNSLLEASACGCKIVIASDFQENSYIPADYLTLCSMEFNDALSSIHRAIQSVTNHNLIEFIKKNYSWEIVGSMIEQRYRIEHPSDRV